MFTTGNSDLPNNWVGALLPAGDGALWVGTEGGLARLANGRVEQVLTTAQGLPHNSVWSLLPAGDGALWVGTEGGLARLASGRVEQVLTTAEGLPGNGILELLPAGDGALWVGTEGGLARLANGQVEQVLTTAEGLPDSAVWAILPAGDGVLWVGTNGGLARLTNGQVEQVLATAEGLPNSAVRALLPAEDGALWIGTLGGLARLANGRVEQVLTTPQGLPDHRVWSLLPAGDGVLWVGTDGGLARLADNRVEQVFSTAQGLPGNGILELLPAGDGALWVGTEGGLARLANGQVEQVFTTVQGLPDNNWVWALLPAEDGTLWVGTAGGLGNVGSAGGLARLANGRVEQVFTSEQGLPDSRVWSLSPAEDGVLWVGTSGGLARLANGRVEQVFSTAQGLPDNWVLALSPAGDRALWVGTAGGLARLVNGRVEEPVLITGEGNLIFSLVAAGEGALWVGTTFGLARVANGLLEQVLTTAEGLPDSAVRALLPAEDGALWVGTEGGLARLAGGRVEQVLTTAQGLPDNFVLALLPAEDGALWVGTKGGLARLANGQVEQVLTTAQGLPSNGILELSPAGDGVLWVGTASGLARLKRPLVPPRIVKLIGEVGSEGGKITQTTHTFAAIPFDPKYQTEGLEWRFLWRLDPPSGQPKEVRTRSSYYETDLEQDGRYVVSVQAIDEYGLKSKPYVYGFDVALPKDDPVEIWAKRIGGWLLLFSSVYFLGLFPLLFLYPRAGWARSAVNSGVFTNFPVLHKITINTRWGRRLIFRQFAIRALKAAEVPDPYIPIFPASASQASPIWLDGKAGSLSELFGTARRALVLGRSGTGKSVFLNFLAREMAQRFLVKATFPSKPFRRALMLWRSGTCKSVLLNFLTRETALRFLRGEDRRLPVLLDLRTHPLAGRPVEELIRDALKGGQVELPDDLLDYLIRKGGFLLLIDSLNELAERAAAEAFHPFLNRDAGNFAIMASQVDLLQRPDFAVYRLAEVSDDQARAYLKAVIGADVWDDLPIEATALARNPQDLELLAEVARALGAQNVPTRRAELYREILHSDTALAEWAKTGSPEMRAVYGLAFRMVRERRVLPAHQFREWLGSQLESLKGTGEDTLAEVAGAISKSRLFKEETEVDVLGKPRPVIGFRHELIGKFLASRHIRKVLRRPGGEQHEEVLGLSAEEEWLDVFYFIIDELDSVMEINLFLKALLERGGDARVRIVAYALGTKPEDMIRGEVRQVYNLAKLGEDLRRTPAA